MIVVCVVALHALALWGMQRGLQPRLGPLALAPMNVELIVPPAPKPAPPPMEPPAPPPPPLPEPPPRKPAKPPRPVAQPAPQPAPQAAPPLALQAPAQPVAEPVVATAAQPGTGAPAPVPAAPAPATPAPAAAGPPSSEAQCGNQKPPYPPLSLRQGETGEVLLSVLIGADGKVQEARLLTSSGYSRLDDAALKAVHAWRCQPVMHDGAPQTAWRNRTVVFELR